MTPKLVSDESEIFNLEVETFTRHLIHWINDGEDLVVYDFTGSERSTQKTQF